MMKNIVITIVLSILVSATTFYVLTNISANNDFKTPKECCKSDKLDKTSSCVDCKGCLDQGKSCDDCPMCSKQVKSKDSSKTKSCCKDKLEAKIDACKKCEACASDSVSCAKCLSCNSLDKQKERSCSSCPGCKSKQ